MASSSDRLSVAKEWADSLVATAPNYVYIIAGVRQVCKIGRTRHPKARLNNIIVNSGDASLRIARQIDCGNAAVPIERACHKRLAHCRITGEWFDISVDQALEVLEGAISDVMSNWNRWS